jgi:hypothetical protein
MNDFAVSGTAGEARATSSAVTLDHRADDSRLTAVKVDPLRTALGRTGRSFVSISVDVEGHIDFESEVEPEHADKMTDVLLLMLLKAREARKRC